MKKVSKLPLVRLLKNNMSQGLYTKDQVIKSIEDAFWDGIDQNGEYAGEYFNAEKYLEDIENIQDQELACSVIGCTEPVFVSHCLQHHNEIIQKNIEQEKLHEDSIIEQAA